MLASFMAATTSGRTLSEGRDPAATALTSAGAQRALKKPAAICERPALCAHAKITVFMGLPFCRATGAGVGFAYYGYNWDVTSFLNVARRSAACLPSRSVRRRRTRGAAALRHRTYPLAVARIEPKFLTNRLRGQHIALGRSAEALLAQGSGFVSLKSRPPTHSMTWIPASESIGNSIKTPLGKPGEACPSDTSQNSIRQPLLNPAGRESRIALLQPSAVLSRPPPIRPLMHSNRGR
jgi:hypothetical protein